MSIVLQNERSRKLLTEVAISIALETKFTTAKYRLQFKKERKVCLSHTAGFVDMSVCTLIEEWAK